MENNQTLFQDYSWGKISFNSSRVLGSIFILKEIGKFLPKKCFWDELNVGLI